MPTFDFKVGTKKYNGEKMRLKSDEILVIEGIHCLNDKLTSANNAFDDGTPLIIEVDINGANGPNVTGRDIFQMVVGRNGLVGSKPADCDTTTQDGRDKCLERYTKNAWPMPIGLLQYYGWKMKY